MNWLGEIIQKSVSPNDTVLDLGCGIMLTTKGLQCKSILGVDIFVRYLEEIKFEYPTVQLSVIETCAFLNESYDIVICTDVLEHLEKQEALDVVKECKRICRKTVIIYTPGVFRNNRQPPSGAWGLGENLYQLHKCIVTEEELKAEGYNVTKLECNLAVYKKL